MLHHYSLVAAILLALSPSQLLTAADYYVAPNGSPDAKGTKDSPWDVTSALAGKRSVKPGETIYLLQGVYEGEMDGIQRKPFVIELTGAKDKPIIVTHLPGQMAHLNGAVELVSSYTHLVGLEIGDLKWDPWQKTHKVPTALNALRGESSKVINCNIFGGAMGTGCWSPSKNLELYGNLIHDFGYLEKSGRGHGHCFYSQNETGTKTVMHNIAYRGCGWNIHIYTQAGQIKGFDIIENICTLAGNYKEGQGMDNYLVAGYPAAERIRLIGNVGYQPRDLQAWRPNMRLSAYRDVVNQNGECRDNYLMGAYYGLSLGRWRNINVTGNTIWATNVLAEVSSGATGSGVNSDTKPDVSGYKIEGNTYIANGKPKLFRYAKTHKPAEGDFLDFEQWQALGFDKTSKLLQGKKGRPTGTKVFVFPNRYEKGRANIGIFNWDDHKSVEVDLSTVLAKGQPYQIFNTLDITQRIDMAKPIMQGTFDGGEINVPCRRSTASPDFDSFLVLPGNK
jgi:hypothetical protein